MLRGSENGCPGLGRSQEPGVKPSSQPVDQTQRCLSPRPRASAVARPASALLFLLVSHGTICPPEDQVTGLQASAPHPTHSPSHGGDSPEMPAGPSRGGQALSSGVSAGTLLISPLQNPSAILQPAPCPAPVPIMARRSRHTVSAALHLTAKNRLAFQAAAGDGHARACLGKTWRGPSCPSAWLKGIWTGHISCSASATEAISVLTSPWCFTRAGPSP